MHTRDDQKQLTTSTAFLNVLCTCRIHHCIRSSDRKKIRRQQATRQMGPHPDPNDDQHVPKLTDVLHGSSFNTYIAHGHLDGEEKSSLLLTQYDRALLCRRETKGLYCVDAKQKSCSVSTERHLRRRQSLRKNFLTVDGWWQKTVYEGWQWCGWLLPLSASWQVYSQHTHCRCIRRVATNRKSHFVFDRSGQENISFILTSDECICEALPSDDSRGTEQWISEGCVVFLPKRKGVTKGSWL